MPVLPNPDPQVWRMLLGDRAEEILSRNEKGEHVSSPSEGSPNEAPPAGNSRAGRDQAAESSRDRQGRDAGDS